MNSEQISLILEELATHGDMHVACLVAGVETSVAEQACAADPDLALLFRRQVARRQSSALGTIHRAIEKGDTMTAKWYMERVNEKYAPPKQRTEVDVATKARAMTDAELLELAGVTAPVLPSRHGQDEEDHAGERAEHGAAATAAHAAAPAPARAPEDGAAGAAEAAWGVTWESPGGDAP